MQNILKALYYGRIKPFEKEPISQEYQTIGKEFEELEGALRRQLEVPQQKQLDALLDKSSELEGAGIVDGFEMGFQLGAKLLLAALGDGTA